MVGRFFPLNWRPPEQEIEFAAAHGFDVVQIRSDEPGAIGAYLRADLAATGAAFAASGVEPVLEMLVRHEGEPRTIPERARGESPGDRRARHQPCARAPIGRQEVEPLLADELGEALLIAEREGLVFGVEHNAPGHRLLVTPEAVGAVLDAVPGLRLRVGRQPHASGHARGVRRVPSARSRSSTCRTRRSRRRTTTFRSAAAPSTSRPARDSTCRSSWRSAASRSRAATASTPTRRWSSRARGCSRRLLPGSDSGVGHPAQLTGAARGPAPGRRRRP